MNTNNINVVALDGVKYKDFNPKENEDQERIVCGDISQEILDEIDKQVAAGEYEQEEMEQEEMEPEEMWLGV